MYIPTYKKYLIFYIVISHVTIEHNIIIIIIILLNDVSMKSLIDNTVFNMKFPALRRVYLACMLLMVLISLGCAQVNININ